MVNICRYYRVLSNFFPIHEIIHRTVLHYAIISGNFEIVDLLLKQGAHVNFSSDYQKPTPLDLAIVKGDVTLVQMLIDAGN